MTVSINYKKALNKSGKHYDCVYVDLGYRIIYFTFDSSVCADLLGISSRELSLLELGERVIGSIEVDD
jgi:hypothetical protein